MRMRAAAAPSTRPRDAMDTILVVNAGSSSVKFQVFAVDSDGRLNRQLKGQMDGIGSRPRLRASTNGEVVADRAYPIEAVGDVSTAMSVAGAWLRDERRVMPFAVGHRVVHGGPDHDRPVLVDHAVVARLERYAALAPLHQPHNLAPIKSILANFPALPQVACFDTAFHRNHPDVADYFALPYRLHEEGVRRYGFHGLSYEYIARKLPEVAPEHAIGRVVVAHLGSGASMCALSAGRSIESTLGFTALDGLPMGTRPGQLDPGVVLYLIEEKGMTPAQLQAFLYKECGLKGLSGISNDMRELLESHDPRASFAIDYFVYRVGLYAGMLAAALQGIDAFVFTAGIGENSADIRARVAEKLQWLGVSVDAGANAKHALKISGAGSRLPVYVIPTDEERMIAEHTLSVLWASRSNARREKAS
jgi:acetate kinase